MMLAAYDRLVNQSPQGIIFAHSWWLDAVAPDSYEILTVHNDEELKAAWPIVYREAGRKARIAMPDLTQKLGIIFAPETGKYAERISQEHRFVDELLEKLPKDCEFDQSFHKNFTNPAFPG